MSLNIFFTLCILGIDFMIYAFFQWTYGDKRRAIARQVAAHREALSARSPRPFLVASAELVRAPRRHLLTMPQKAGQNASTSLEQTARYSERFA